MLEEVLTLVMCTDLMLNDIIPEREIERERERGETHNLIHALPPLHPAHTVSASISIVRNTPVVWTKGLPCIACILEPLTCTHVIS